VIRRKVKDVVLSLWSSELWMIFAVLLTLMNITVIVAVIGTDSMNSCVKCCGSETWL